MRAFYWQQNQNLKKNEEKEVFIPLKLVVGITGALAWMFIILIPLPIPGKVHVGAFLVTTGVTYASDSIIETVEKKDKKKKN